MKYKYCALCTQGLPIDEFGIKNKATGYHYTFCKQCQKLIWQDYVDNHRDEINASRRRRYREKKLSS